MKEIIIKEKEAGQRFDKFLKKYMPEAPESFFYKMLRKKNIVLNGKKASGKEKLKPGESVKFFLSDETIQKFSGDMKKRKFYVPPENLPVIYEDADILILNKPAGMLSQRAGKEEPSVVEYVIGYLLETGKLTEEELRTFKPGVCNRLDRGTSGLIAAGKSLAGLQILSELFRTRAVKKYYLCIVKGCITEKKHMQGFLKKEEERNRVIVKDTLPPGEEGEGFCPIETEYIPVAGTGDATLLKVHLITGRTHQIRGHLSASGHPLLGDYKYGDRSFNDRYKKKYQITSQLLHAYELVFPEDMDGRLARLSGRTFCAKVPPVFYKVIKETAWQHGIREALEVQH